jgi:hypothetical protein
MSPVSHALIFLLGVKRIKGRTRLRVFENRVLRRILGPTREKITGGWKTLQIGELDNFYFSPDVITVTCSRSMR